MAVLNNSNAISPSGYDINNSLRFRSSASAYLNRTFTTPTSATIFTWSGWVKRGTLGTVQAIFSGSNGTNTSMLFFDNTDVLGLYWNNGATVFTTTAVFRDPSAWYHIVCYVSGTTQRIYVNNQLLASTTSGATPIYLNTAIAHYISYQPSQTRYIDGYLAEVNFIDGQALTPSSFGSTNAITGVWQPAKYTGTYGTNGFYLKFSDIATTSGSNAGLGKDFSGNSNYWTTNNISVTAGSTYDAMTDTPTLTSDTISNYTTISPLISSTNSIQNGNLSVYRSTAGSGVYYMSYSPFVMTSGKWYFEMHVPTVATHGPWAVAGIFAYSYASTTSQANYPSYPSAPNFYGVGINASNDIVGIAYDADNGKLWLSRNGTWLSGNPSTNTSPSYSGLTITNNYLPGVYTYTNGLSSDGYHNFNFGQRLFAYTLPTGFNRLNTYNLPDSTIKKGNSYMDAVLWTGNNASNRTISTNFNPDFLWIKPRSLAESNSLFDKIRGDGLRLVTNSTSAESNITWAKLISNGFQVDGTTFNNNSETFVGWHWLANGAGSSNTSGSITSTVSVNTTAGFSIVTYTGTGANATVGHGLGVAPAMMIIKQRNSAQSWSVYHASLGATKRLYLDLTDAVETTTTAWNSTAPTSTVYSVGTSAATNSNGGTFVAYCFAEISGYSKFGSYTGNGSADGPFVYTGFRPKYVLVKRTDTAGYSWIVLDSARSTYNVASARLIPNTSDAEASGTHLEDFLSNGFKLRGTSLETNGSGGTYIYMAFAENPFKNSLAR